jgi:hypothetical protein
MVVYCFFIHPIFLLILQLNNFILLLVFHPSLNNFLAITWNPFFIVDWLATDGFHNERDDNQDSYYGHFLVRFFEQFFVIVG